MIGMSNLNTTTAYISARQSPFFYLIDIYIYIVLSKYMQLHLLNNINYLLNI